MLLQLNIMNFALIEKLSINFSHYNFKRFSTAYAALGDFPIPTGSKTGTAQFTKPEIQSKIGRRDYAWYVGYAPADNPKIAISIVIFDGGYVAMCIIKHVILHETLLQPIKWVYAAYFLSLSMYHLTIVY